MLVYLLCSAGQQSERQFSDRCRVESRQSDTAQRRLRQREAQQRAGYQGRLRDHEKALTKEAEERKAGEKPANDETAIAKWIDSAEAACRYAPDAKACDARPEGASDEEHGRCTARCALGARDGLLAMARRALDVCRDAYVETGGKSVSCKLNLSAGALLEPSAVEKQRAQCDKMCAADGARLLAASKDADAKERKGYRHVINYKHCMMAVDQTAEARKYERYDLTLYLHLMTNADQRCRKANQCDWVEENTRLSCSYGD